MKNKTIKLVFFFIFIVLSISLILNIKTKKQARDKENIGNISVHPYLGFVSTYGGDRSVNPYGFVGELKKPDSSDINIYILGGSVALNYYYYEKENLYEKLVESGRFTNKNINIYSFALGGYKQPQQLFTLLYLITLGLKPNYVINIDGFNESALSYAENYQRGTSTFFPRNWNLVSRTLYNKETIFIINYIYLLKNIDNTILTFPPSINKIFHQFILKLTSLAELSLEKKMSQLENTYQTKGPEPYLSSSKEEVIKNIIDVWFNSSLQMQKIANSNNFAYFEYLQPNQYLPNTKPYSKIELSKFVNKNHPYAQPTYLIYPKIISRIQELRKEGVGIFDLTGIFNNHPETLYFDDCCHYIPEGYSLLTPYIYKNIVEY